jgi:hypothetical protein
MIELKNYKTIYLGKVSGGDRYSVDAFIGAVQMRESGGQWQDIRPGLVRDTGGWHIEGAPYYAELKDDGTRLFCPDRNERGKYLRLPAPGQFAGLGRNIISNPAKLDKAPLPNQITMPTEWGEFRIIFSNTGMHFEVLFNKAPPYDVFGKDSPRIVLDAETAGYDIESLLKATSGIGIPRPRILPANLEAVIGESQERWLGWDYKNGQLELGFDFGDLQFPILLKNTTINLQVDADADDLYMKHEASACYNYYGTICLGNNTSPNTGLGGATRFALSIPQGAAIDTAHLSCYSPYAKSGTACNLRITAEDVDNASAYSNTWATEIARYNAHTTAVVDVDNVPSWGTGTWHDSPEIKTVIQEIIDRSGWASGNYIGLYTQDFDYRSDTGAYRMAYDYHTDPSYATKLHVEYTAGGATAKTAAETGSGTEVSSLLAAMAKAESGGGLDTRFSFLAGLAKADGGNGIDAAVLSAGLVANETGLGADSGMTIGLKQLFSGDDGGGGDFLKALIAASSSGSDMKLPGWAGHVRIPSRGVSI